MGILGEVYNLPFEALLGRRHAEAPTVLLFSKDSKHILYHSCVLQASDLIPRF